MLGQQEEVCDAPKDEVLMRAVRRFQQILGKDTRDMRADDEVLGGLYPGGVGGVVMESTCTLVMVKVLFRKNLRSWSRS